MIAISFYNKRKSNMYFLSKFELFLVKLFTSKVITTKERARNGVKVTLGTTSVT